MQIREYNTTDSTTDTNNTILVGSQVMMECENGMGPETLEAVLRRCAEDRQVVRVIKMSREPAVAKGENYLSTITRISLKVVAGDGSVSSKSLILKEVPLEEAKRQMISKLGIFRMETEIYTKVLRQMEMVMKEHQETEDILWGRLICHQPYSWLLLEDLKDSGFQLRPRQLCMDLEHAHLVLHNLGRYHGMAKIIEQLGIIDGNDFKPYSLANDKHLIKLFLHCGLQTVSKAMKESWGPAWHGFAEKLKLPLEILEEKMLSIGGVDESRFNVLNHGDCWSNNMLFKYDWKNRPIALRFLDFQISHYNSPSWDVTFFMFTSIEPEVRREHYDSLLRTYTDGLLKTLQKYRYAGRHPTHEEIAGEMERLAMFRLIAVTILHGVMTADTTDGLDMEQVILSEGTRGHFTEVYCSQRYKNRVAPDLIRLAEQGII